MVCIQTHPNPLETSFGAMALASLYRSRADSPSDSDEPKEGMRRLYAALGEYQGCVQTHPLLVLSSFFLFIWWPSRDQAISGATCHVISFRIQWPRQADRSRSRSPKPSSSSSSQTSPGFHWLQWPQAFLNAVRVPTDCFQRALGENKLVTGS